MTAVNRTTARAFILGWVAVVGLGLGVVPAQAVGHQAVVHQAVVDQAAGHQAAVQALGAASSAAAGRPAGSYVPVSSARILDTRSGLGAGGPLAGNHEILLSVTAKGGIPPTGAASIVLTLTVTNPTLAGYLTVYPDGFARPATSNIDFAAGQTIANTVVVRVGAGGRIRLFYGAGTGSVQLVADTAGYYTSGTPTDSGAFQVVAAQRIMDTRSGLGGARASLGATATRVLTVGGVGGVPAGARAVVLNVGVFGATANGSVTVFPRSGPRPGTSNVSFIAGQARSGLTIVPVSPAGQVSLFNGSTRPVNAVVDVLGYYLGGYPAVFGSFLTFTAARVVDTTTGLGAAGPVAPHGSITVQVGGLGEIPGPGTTSIALNVTVKPTGGGYLSVYPTGVAQPTTSNINYVPGAAVSNLVILPVRSDGKVVLFNAGVGSADIQVDVLGVFLDGTGAARCNLARTDPSGDSITQWNPVVYCVLSVLNQPSSEVGDVDIMIQYESSGDPNAINNYDINAQQGHPSEGLIQVIRPTFDTYRSSQLPNDLFNPAANLYAGLNYAINTYGSIHNVPGLVSLRNGGGYQGYIVNR
jgi:hypothetical protein